MLDILIIYNIIFYGVKSVMLKSFLIWDQMFMLNL